ncbi:hypothetical protein WJX72_007177 [[Myrmecia] bisecta]|uniref:Uncharacterized protein n=1 Tax=[Myrmecia] bisecta TaxID=41462 RepID=A0AAW1PEN0_9CHLO
MATDTALALAVTHSVQVADHGEPIKFLFLQPGGRTAEVPNGGDDLLTVFELNKLYDHTQQTMRPGNFLKGVAGEVQIWGGERHELAPLADVFPIANRPDAKPINKDMFERAFKLQPGQVQLAEGLQGTPVTSAWRGADSSAPVSGGIVALAGVNSAKKAKKDKKDKKEKKDKKQKKDKRDREGVAGASRDTSVEQEDRILKRQRVT